MSQKFEDAFVPHPPPLRRGVADPLEARPSPHVLWSRIWSF